MHGRNLIKEKVFKYCVIIKELARYNILV